MTCPGDLEFDIQLNVCNWPELANCQSKTTTTEASMTTTTEVAAETTTTEAAVETTTTEAVSYTHLTLPTILLV